LTENIDIYRAAKQLIDQHGDAATFEASTKADGMLETGDLEGQRVWLRILKAIKDIQNTTPDGLLN
jgi:hypothetical protein